MGRAERGGGGTLALGALLISVNTEVEFKRTLWKENATSFVGNAGLPADNRSMSSLMYTAYIGRINLLRQ